MSKIRNAADGGTAKEGLSSNIASIRNQNRIGTNFDRCIPRIQIEKWIASELYAEASVRIPSNDL